MKRKIITFIVVSSVVVSAAYGQALTLDECHASAIEHNRTLKNNRLERLAATQSRKEAFTHYFPQLSATGSAFQSFEHLIQADFSIPDMGTMPLSLLKKGVVGGITAVQPLFAGGKIVQANKLARIGEEVATLQLQKSEAEVREQTAIYFWQIVQLRDHLSTLDAVEKQLNEIHRQVQTAIGAGIATKNDLLRVDLRKQEVASQRLKLENGMKVSRMLLATHIGVPYADFDICYDGKTVSEPSVHYLSPEEAVSLRAEYQLAEKGLVASKHQTKMTRADYLPTVGVGAGYLYYNMMEKNVGQGLVFAQVSIPLSGWWSGSHALKKARINEQRAENDRLHAREMLILEIEKEWSNLCEAYAQITLAERSVASSAENLRQNSLSYQAGAITLSDLLDAETLHSQSLNNLMTTKAAYHTAVAQYQRVTGR